MFDPSKMNELESALDQSIVGSLSYNGQRCTALKLFYIPEAYGEAFAKKLAGRVEKLTVGLPWQRWSDGSASSLSYSKITPLPNKSRTDHMKRLIDDAVSKGAKIMNENGGSIIGGSESTLMVPAVLYPVDPSMDIFYEEQFGPVVPIATYDSLDSVLKYGREGDYGQQVSIFTSDTETEAATLLLDSFSSVFGKININQQCGRSPDTLPFSGRRSSAMGTMSGKFESTITLYGIPSIVRYDRYFLFVKPNNWFLILLFQ